MIGNQILKSWRIVTIKGLVTTVLGLSALFTPPAYADIFIRIFGTLFIVSGSILIYDYFTNPASPDWKWRFAEGLVDGFFGLITLSLGWVTASNFFVVITAWVTLIGVLQVSNAYRLRSLFHHWKILMLNGLLGIMFSAGLILSPYENTTNKIIIMFLLSILFVTFLIISSFYLKRLVEDIHTELPRKQGEEGNQELSYY
ncbi:MAG TPA: DUF308 domain-containing protein [Cyclobacteriaceae bacterium]|nr:DUF308 domain-containing protein [Cyclobacteriaceae bacterium]